PPVSTLFPYTTLFRSPVDPGKLETVLEQGVGLARRARKRKEAFALLDRARAEMQARSGLEEQFQQALPAFWLAHQPIVSFRAKRDRKSTRLNSSHLVI